MADELPDDATTGLGQHLFGHAAVPGVIRPDLAAGIQRRFSIGGGGLAAEIWQRWCPTAAPAWGYGLGLTYAGFGSGWGGWAGAVPNAASGSPRPAALTPGSSPSLTPGLRGEGSEGRASSIPLVSAPLDQQAEGKKGTDLDVISSPSPEGPGVGGPAEGPGRSRVAVRRSPAAPVHPAAPSGGSGTPVTSGTRSVALVQRKAAGAAASPQPSHAEEGSAIVRRAVDATLAQRASLPPAIVQRKAAAAAPSSASVAEAGPAIVRRPADLAPAQRASALRSRAEMGRAIFRRSSSGPAPASMPLPRIPAPADGSTLPSRTESGPEIAHYAASPAPRQVASSPPAASGPLPSAPLLLFPPPARTGAEPAAPAAALGLPAVTTNLLPAAGLPFAPPTRVIERVIERDAAASAAQPHPGTGVDAATSPPALLPGPFQGAARPAASEKLDLDDLAERVQRRLTRSLAAERERHGGRRWLS